MKLINQLLRKNPDCNIKKVVLFKNDFNRQSFSYYGYNELVKLCQTDEEFKDLVFVSGYIQKSFFGDDVLYAFVNTKDFDELFSTP